ADDSVNRPARALEEVSPLTERQFVNHIACHAMAWDVERVAAFAQTVKSVLRRLLEEAVQILDVFGPGPRSLIRQPLRQAALSLDRQRVILMACAVGPVIDRRIFGEKPRLLYVEASVRNGLVDIECVIALPRVGPDVGNAETCIPALMLHRQV